MLKVYRSEKGSALVLVICSIAILSVLVTAMMKLSVNSYEAASTKEKASQALGLAEAGVSHALSEIKKASSISEVPAKINNLTGNLSIDGQSVGRYELFDLVVPPSGNKVGFKMLGEDINSIQKEVGIEVEFKPAPAPGTNFLTLFQYPVASSTGANLGGSATIEGCRVSYVSPVSGIPTDAEIKAIVEKFSELATWSNIGDTTLRGLSTVPNPDPYPVYFNKGKLTLQGLSPSGTTQVNGKGIIAVDGDVEFKSDIGTGINDEIVIFATGKLTLSPSGNRMGNVLVLASEISLGGSGTYDFNGSLVTNKWPLTTTGNPQFNHNLNLSDKFKVVFNTHFSSALTKPDVAVLKWDEIN